MTREEARSLTLGSVVKAKAVKENLYYTVESISTDNPLHSGDGLVCVGFCSFTIFPWCECSLCLLDLYSDLEVVKIKPFYRKVR